MWTIRESPRHQNRAEATRLHTNTLGSVGTTTWPDGTWLSDEIYDPWGQRWALWNGLLDEQFAGMQMRDAESGLDQTPNRMFTSQYGRWMSADPLAGDITNPQSLIRYAYVMNNPTSLVDPLGLGPCPLVEEIDQCGGGNGGGNDFGGYTVDGFSVSNGMGQALLQSGFGVQCPNNDCNGLVYPNNGQNEIYKWVHNANLTLNCAGSDFFNTPDYSCGWAYWSKQFVAQASQGFLGPNDSYYAGEAWGRALFGKVASEAGSVTDSRTYLGWTAAATAVAATPLAANAAAENLEFLGPSPGFSYSNGRAFGVLWDDLTILRLDLHPMGQAGDAIWHLHLWAEGGTHGIVVPFVWPF